jgi:hypothetical protein
MVMSNHQNLQQQIFSQLVSLFLISHKISQCIHSS